MRHSLLSAALLLLTSACVTVGPDSDNPTKHSLGPWIEPTPQLADKIEQNAQRLPWTTGIERVELIQWFAKVGEPAYPKLLEMVNDPRADVAGAALAAIGATRDARLVEPLRELPWPDEQHPDVALERARTLLRLGDWSLVPHLIDGLEDERLMVRALCARRSTRRPTSASTSTRTPRTASGPPRWRAGASGGARARRTRCAEPASRPQGRATPSVSRPTRARKRGSSRSEARSSSPRRWSGSS